MTSSHSGRIQNRLKIHARALFTLLISGAILPQASFAETTFERIQRTREVRLGYAREAPFAFRAPDGRLTGSAPEVARRVFSKMGVDRITGIESEFEALIRDLKAGRFDVIAGGMLILPERCRRVIFSEPYYRAGVGFAVRPGNPRRLYSFEDVADSADVRLGVVAGAVEIDYARRSGVAEGQLLIFPDAVSAIGGVKAGRVDAFAAMAVTVEELVQRDPRQLERAVPFRNPGVDGGSTLGHGGFAFRPGDTDLRDAFNRHLAELLKDPAYLELIHPFGFTGDELPVRATNELCTNPAKRSED
jgi:polar amino acid transport system substrate-binding protein